MGVSTNILNIFSNNKCEQSIMDYKPELPNLRISADRIKHMHRVAEFMYEYYDDFKCKYLSREEIYVLGLNHDIGYMDGKEGHEAFGTNLFEGFCDFNNMIPICILHHGSTPKEYMENCMCSEDEIPRELILLWYADLSVESAGEHAGEVVGFQGRLNGLKERYGEDSVPYHICKETIEWLIDYLSREILS